MKTHVAAVRGALRAPGYQDAGVAVLLLVATWAVAGASAAPMSGLGQAAWLPEPVTHWALIGICIAAVAVRRRWQLVALVAASLATLVQMALVAGPTPADLAVPIIVCTIAAQRPPKESLALLGLVLVVATAWSVHVGLDGKTDGWRYEGQPFAVGGEERTPGEQALPPPEDERDEPGRGGRTTSGPTDWGGIPVLGAVLIGAWAIGWGVRSRHAYLREREARARDLDREREQQAALAVAAERARINRELHDVVAHGLAVIVMQAQGGAAAFAKRPADTLAALDTIVATGRAAIADIRHVLAPAEETDGPPRPVPGLVELPRLVEQVGQAGTPVRLQIDGSPRPLPTGVDVSSYRIVQEALTNTMKHAGPGASAQVTVSYGHDELLLEVRDDGVGESPVVGSGNGLRGMRERAALLGGEVSAGPAPDGGFLVRAHFPISPEDLPGESP